MWRRKPGRRLRSGREKNSEDCDVGFGVWRARYRSRHGFEHALLKMKSKDSRKHAESMTKDSMPQASHVRLVISRVLNTPSHGGEHCSITSNVYQMVLFSPDKGANHTAGIASHKLIVTSKESKANRHYGPFHLTAINLPCNSLHAGLWAIIGGQRGCLDSRFLQMAGVLLVEEGRTWKDSMQAI